MCSSDLNEDGGVFIVTSNGICYMDTEGKIRSLDKFPYYNNYDIVAVSYTHLDVYKRQMRS